MTANSNTVCFLKRVYILENSGNIQHLSKYTPFFTFFGKYTFFQEMYNYPAAVLNILK